MILGKVFQCFSSEGLLQGGSSRRKVGLLLVGEEEVGSSEMLRPVVRPASPSVGVMLLQLVVWLQILTAMITHSSVSGLDIALSNKDGFERATSCRHSVARIEITNTVRLLSIG